MDSSPMVLHQSALSSVTTGLQLQQGKAETGEAVLEADAISAQALTSPSLQRKPPLTEVFIQSWASHRQGGGLSLVCLLLFLSLFFPLLFFLSFSLAAGRLFKVANKFQLMKPEKPELGAKRNKSNQYRRNRKRILKAGLGIITC